MTDVLVTERDTVWLEFGPFVGLYWGNETFRMHEIIAGGRHHLMIDTRRSRFGFWYPSVVSWFSPSFGIALQYPRRLAGGRRDKTFVFKRYSNEDTA